MFCPNIKIVLIITIIIKINHFHIFDFDLKIILHYLNSVLYVMCFLVLSSQFLNTLDDRTFSVERKWLYFVLNFQFQVAQLFIEYI